MNSDINVTPLVDVCLVLLIIFMVVVPAMVNGVDVKLPGTKSGGPVANRILPITIKDDGTVYLGDDVMRRDEVPAALGRMRATDASRPIAVRADKRVEYGEVMSVIDDARKAGWVDVTLVGVRE